MKILHLSNYYYPDIGGIEQVARDCVHAFEGKAEQRLLCFSHKKKDVTETVDGIEVTRAGTFAKVSSQSLSFSYKKLLKKQFKHFQPDVVIFHYPNPFAAHYLLKLLKKHPACKLIVYWHLDITKQKILGKFFHGQNKRICARASAVIGATPVHLEESAYYPCFKDKCRVVPYGISRERLSLNEDIVREAERIRGENEGKTICFAMGRHVPYKGMEYLVRASKLLRENFRIYIAGEGELTAELKQLAKGDEKVVFLGRIPHETALGYLSACDIFCFPSITRNEGFGLALAEAMYCGKPAVTFHIPHSGVNYVSLDGVTGLEVENRNVEEYAKAIEKLASDPQLCQELGAAGKARVEENFTFEKFREKILELTESII